MELRNIHWKFEQNPFNRNQIIAIFIAWMFGPLLSLIQTHMRIHAWVAFTGVGCIRPGDNDQFSNSTAPIDSRPPFRQYLPDL